jgi:DUF971 family protein
MLNIKRFSLQPKQAKLAIDFSNKIMSVLNYEYIRVFSPLDGFNSPAKKKTFIAHKQQVQLIAIESVAQHGYRFIFNDQHSAIYSVEYLKDLCKNEQKLWQEYLAELKKSGHTREATISITQL